MTLNHIQPIDANEAKYPSISAEQVQGHLTSILASEEFRASSRLTSLLRYLVKETLAGRGNQLKAYKIAVEAFSCAADFDPQLNPLVRIHAAKLRRALERYYLTDGVQDSIRIEVPKGGYLVSLCRPASTPAQAPFKPSITQPCISVFPLLNRSADSSQDDFADGLTEQLVIRLSRFANLTVIARHSTLRYQERPIDTQQIYEELGARFLLQGSVRRVALTVRVTIKLTDASNDRVLWGEHYDCALTNNNLFVLQDEICERVATRIGNQYGVISRTLQDEQRDNSISANLSATRKKRI